MSCYQFHSEFDFQSPEDFVLKCSQLDIASSGKLRNLNLNLSEQNPTALQK